MSNDLPDLARCADEPIRTPGAIQPHGRLVVASADGTRVLAWSANWPGVEAARSALRLLEPNASAMAPGGSPHLAGTVELEGRLYDGAMHRRGDALLVEFEPAAPRGQAAPIYTVARAVLPRLHAAGTVADLCAIVAREMKQLTGFGRCLVYRFDADGHGEVLAEERDAGYDAYAGHRFPASDVPAQARALYLANHIRLIPDAHYTPVPLLAVDGFDAAGLDLGFASLRSVSPVHLEYMRNMGTIASMSVSILVRGRLWGLISCHDHAPRHLAFPTRVACEHLGHLLSLQVEAKEDSAEVAQRLALHQRVLSTVAQLGESDNSLQRLLQPALEAAAIAQAQGIAVVLNEQCWCSGQTPPADVVRRIAHWVADQGGELFATDRAGVALREVAPPDGIAGVLAISISQVHRHVVLWFRPELVQTILWAGDPGKGLPSASGRIHPRLSFQSWQEKLRGRSAPWTAAEQAAVLELRQALIALVLRRAEELAGYALELGRVNKELEAFSYTVSHDLRAPMRHIAGYVDLVLEDNQLDERSRRYLAHVKNAAAYAGQLVDALLDFSRMGRSALKPTLVDTQALVDDLVQEIGAMEKGRRIEWSVQKDLPRLWADPLLLQVAVRNLVANAAKYSRGRDPTRIGIAAVQRAGCAGLEVSDNGVGFPMKYVGKLFGVFQRLHRVEDFDGTGIGLANVKRIVERHGGTVWARGEPDQGASFGFALPLRPAEGPAPNQNKKESD